MTRLRAFMGRRDGVSTLVVITACAALTVLLGIGTAGAHHGQITSAEIKDGTIRAVDMEDGSVTSEIIRNDTIRDVDLDRTLLSDLRPPLRVTPQNERTWSSTSSACGGTATGSQTFVNGTLRTPPLGTGSREFRTGSDGSSYETYRDSYADGRSLAALTRLRYSTLVRPPHGDNEQAPYLILNVDRDGDGDEDDLLFFEPVYQDDVYPVADAPDQGNVHSDQWQTWNALIGKWSVGNQDIGNPGAAGLTTLDAYRTANPNAIITKFRIAAGCGGAEWADFIAYTDAVEAAFNNIVRAYDFERS